MIRIRDTTFSIPIDDIREVVTVPMADVVNVQGRRAIDVRGQYISLLGVDDIFDWNDLDPGRHGVVKADDSNGGTFCA